MRAKKPDSLHPIDQYCADVLSGKIVTGKLVRLAVERHVRDLATAGKRGFYFDWDAAQHIIDFAGFCCHVEGELAGQPIKLEPWHQFILGNVFGWLRKSDGKRRFRTVYTEIARKNTKSTILAIVGLYLLKADREAGAQVYSAATKKDQARIIHGIAVRMVKRSPHLNRRLSLFKDCILDPETESTFAPLGADSDTLDGLNVHGALIDELHAHKTSGVFDVIDSATGARSQPLIFCITTAGFSKGKPTICQQLRDYSIKIMQGIREDDSFFSYIACLDEGDDPFDERNWLKANPNLGLSVKIDDLRKQALRARENPTALYNFLVKRLNVWTSQNATWLGIDKWNACRRELSLEDMKGRDCYGGLDLSSTTDITALSLVFPVEEVREAIDDKGELRRRKVTSYKVFAFFWVPEECGRSRGERQSYKEWIELGLIQETDGSAVDYDVIQERILELRKQFRFKQIAVDRWNAQQIVNNLEKESLEMVAFGQGFKDMGPAVAQAEGLIADQRIYHDGNPVLGWMFSNVSMKKDPAGFLKPDKEKSADKIDGIVAMLMAIGRATTDAPPISTIYEKRTLLTV
jgi:phage terminase large subunit-like protein